MFPSFSSVIHWDIFSESASISASTTLEPSDWTCSPSSSIPSVTTSDTQTQLSPLPSLPPPLHSVFTTCPTPSCRYFLQGKPCFRHHKATCRYVGEYRARHADLTLRLQKASQKVPQAATTVSSKVDGKRARGNGKQLSDGKDSSPDALVPVHANIPKSSNQWKNTTTRKKKDSTVNSGLPTIDSKNKERKFASNAQVIVKEPKVAEDFQTALNLPPPSRQRDDISKKKKKDSTNVQNTISSEAATIAKLRGYTASVTDDRVPLATLKASTVNLDIESRSSTTKNKVSWKKNPAWMASRLKIEERYENEKPARPLVKFCVVPKYYSTITADNDPKPDLRPVVFPIQYSDWNNDKRVQEVFWAKANLSPATVNKFMRTYLEKERVAYGSFLLTNIDNVKKGKGRFRRFPELPGEVRNIIWSYAIEDLQVDCLIKQTCKYEIDGVQHGRRLKRMGDTNPFLFVSRESRTLALDRHELTFGNKFHGNSILFDYQRDRLFIVAQSPMELKETVQKYLVHKDRKRVRFLMVPLKNFLSNKEKTVHAITSFKYLEHVWFIVGDGKEEEPWSKHPHVLSELRFHVKEMHKCRFRDMLKEQVPPVPKVTLNVVPAQVSHELKLDGCQWVV